MSNFFLFKLCPSCKLPIGAAMCSSIQWPLPFPFYTLLPCKVPKTTRAPKKNSHAENEMHIGLLTGALWVCMGVLNGTRVLYECIRSAGDGSSTCHPRAITYIDCHRLRLSFGLSQQPYHSCSALSIATRHLKAMK